MLTAGSTHVRIALSGGDTLWLGHTVRVHAKDGSSEDILEPKWYHEEQKSGASLMQPVTLADACRKGGIGNVAAMILASYAVLDMAIAVCGAGKTLPSWYSRTVDAFSRELLTVRQDLRECSGAVMLALVAADSAFPLASNAIRTVGREVAAHDEVDGCSLA